MDTRDKKRTADCNRLFVGVLYIWCKSSKCRNSCVDYDFDFCCQCNIRRTVCRSGNYAAHGSYLEMAMTTFIINVRYMLMSFSLSQKVDKKMTLRQRLMIGYGITDEIFAVSSMETESLSARFMYGLITVPVFGWTVGTAAGALASQIMPGALSAAMELGLYAMFIAIIIPPAKKSKAVLFVIGIAVICQCIFTATPVLKEISIGFQVILSTVIAASIGAFMFPVKKEVKA